MYVETGYTFDDLLLIPKHSNVESRDKVDLSVQLPRGIKLGLPLVSANMKTVTGPRMARTIARLGGLAILHRFDYYDVLVDNFKEATAGLYSEGVLGEVGASVGVHENDFELVKNLYKCGCKIFCVDVAHGDHILVTRFISQLRKELGDVLIVAGNVATESGANLIWELGADIIKIGVGPGCFAAGTRILMSNGTYKNIEDIKPGDRVINKDGKSRSVLNAFSTGVRKVVKVRNSIFYRDTYTTPDHKYFVGDLSTITKTFQSEGYAKSLSKPTRKGDSKLKWQEIGASNKVALLLPKHIEFELADDFDIPIYIRDGGNGYSSVKNTIDCHLTPGYELGYLFGTFLGDGHAMIANNGKTNTGAVYWYFGLEEGEIAEKLKSCVRFVCNRSLKIKKKDNIILCSLYHKPLAEYLASFGKGIYKHLPNNLFVKDYNYLQGLLDGLIDSDGTIEKNGRINFTNTSQQLIELFNVVTYLLTGTFPNNQKCNVSVGNLTGANIENFNTTYVARINTTASKRLIDLYQVSKLLEYSVQDENLEVFDLTIDCDTHSFIADNAIVHNSLCTTRVETGNGYPQLSALYNVTNGVYRSREDDDKTTYPTFIADGGIKSAGDCVKALCFADLVMIGNLFAGTDEAPGEVITVNSQKYKSYVGSSTHKQKHVEGVVGLVPYKGSVCNVVTKLVEGIRSGCSYQGAGNLKDLKKDPRFVSISNSGLIESHPHDVKL